ncbi:MAG TPA: N-acetylmuramidase domain-containing protein, partial [Blastocatellia bacterium]
MAPVQLTEADFEDAAHALGCDVEAVHAVADVETQGSGFLPDGRAVILFESHTFGEKTGHQYDASHPNL